MCGIHGFFRFDGQRVEPAQLTAMGDRTQHRGPDDEGQYIDGPCGIAMRRLSIIDLAGGHQPISNADDSLWIVCNGEIYNFRELRAELQGLGFHFKTGSDSEVVLHAYDAFGDDFVHRLNGMFDFALWDRRRKRLLIGRDRIGQRLDEEGLREPRDAAEEAVAAGEDEEDGREDRVAACDAELRRRRYVRNGHGVAISFYGRFGTFQPNACRGAALFVLACPW